MYKKNILVVLMIIILNILLLTVVFAQEPENPPDESDTFTSVAPDALIILDLSGSMAFNPAGDDPRFGSSSSCSPDTVKCSGTGCTGGYCTNSKTNCNINCSRIEIAKVALANILDDTGNNIIDVNDMNSLGIRIGFMRYRDGDDTSGNYSTGNIKLVRPMSTLGDLSMGTKYSQIFCNNTTSCNITARTCSPLGECIAGETTNGGTPLASALKEAKTYLNAHKASDPAKSCRQKFVIVITDGADTYACSGNGSECNNDGVYKRRREVVAAAKALKDAGYKTFVVGFGSTMPGYLQNTLNWMAYYGGTENEVITTPTTLYNPATVTSCGSSTDATATCIDNSGTHNTDNFQATTNDPGYLAISGYAFLAGNADELANALKTAFNVIKEATYSFTQFSIQAVRTIDENFLYEASFEPINDEPFWHGHMKRYGINGDGSIKATEDWDSGSVLQGTSAAGRTILTYKGGSLKAFNTANITASDLAITTGTDPEKEALRQSVIAFTRGGDYASDPDNNWKLGDIFHSSPVTVGTPSMYYFDTWDPDYSMTNAYITFYNNNQRPSSSGKRIILVGANDGQLHAFKTGEAGSGGGQEVWSFIPPNLLPKLKTIVHSSHPSSLSHMYFVDGETSVSDVYTQDMGLDLTNNVNTSAKNVGYWKTFGIVSEGRGGSSTLWSNSTSCDSGFNARYTDVSSNYYPNYCGYYAFDITNTLSPLFRWRLGGNSGFGTSSTDAVHLGEPWSKIVTARVRDGLTEKWIGVVGGGYSGNNCGSGTCDTRGKGFFMARVIDGTIHWRYTRNNNGAMNYDLAATPSTVDMDNDGFADAAYAGDLGANMWGFKFCTANDGPSCTNSSWSAKSGKIFNGVGSNLSIYTRASVSEDEKGNIWVMFGTGNKTDPNGAPAARDKFFAVKDKFPATPPTVGNLVNISSGLYTDSDSNPGWVITLPNAGEKILADTAIYNGVIYFTTYTPGDTSNPCEQSGAARIYAINYLTGKGLFAGGDRSQVIGQGIPSSPIVSINPITGTADIYASVSVVSGSGSHTSAIPQPPPGPCLYPPCPCGPPYPCSPCTTPPCPERPTPAKHNLIYWYHKIQ